MNQTRYYPASSESTFNSPPRADPDWVRRTAIMKKQSNKHDIGRSPDYQDAPITPEGIRSQLDHVLSSPDLKASNKVKTIFHYLRDETLAGRQKQISTPSIADKAHNGPLDPDPPIDPPVRIQLNRLRRALKECDG